jgi:hypothetical protein
MVRLKISGKVSDRCDYQIVDDGSIVIENDGYVPYGLGVGGGDYLRLEIDIETGTIIGWDAEKVKRSVSELLNERLDGEDGEEHDD